MYEVYALLLNFKKAYVIPLTLRTADEIPETLQVDLSDDQSVLMQFTGVVDGHGTPIYEGDILERFHEADEDDEDDYDLYRRKPVVFRGGGFGEYDEDYPGAFMSFSDWNHIKYTEAKIPHLWICGTIYEHPNWEELNERTAMRADLHIREEDEITV